VHQRFKLHALTLLHKTCKRKQMQHTAQFC
jgi:hypothetical protein